MTDETERENDLADLVRRVVDGNVYMVLGTADPAPQALVVT